MVMEWSGVDRGQRPRLQATRFRTHAHDPHRANKKRLLALANSKTFRKIKANEHSFRTNEIPRGPSQLSDVFEDLSSARTARS